MTNTKVGVQKVTWFAVESIPAKKMIWLAPMQEVRLTRMWHKGEFLSLQQANKQQLNEIDLEVRQKQN